MNIEENKKKGNLKEEEKININNSRETKEKMQIKKKEEKKDEKKIELKSNKKEKPIKENKLKGDIKKEVIKQKSGKEELQNQNPSKEENCADQIKEVKDSNNNPEGINELPKTLLTQKIEDNYDLMLKYLKDNNYKRGDDYIINGIINYEDFSSDKFLGLVSDKKNIDNKHLINDFIKRNIEDTKLRQNNNKTINDRIKLIDESVNKKLYFNNKKSQKEYFDTFYNKQIQFKNNCKVHIDQLSQKYDEELKKNYIPELKFKNNLDYFKNNEPVKLSKYSFNKKSKNSNNNNNNQNNINDKKKENEYKNKDSIKLRNKKKDSNNKKIDNHSYNIIKTNNGTINSDESKNNRYGRNNTDNENKKMYRTISEDMCTKNKNKYTKKEIDDITNKLHYDGELLKIKKQQQIMSKNLSSTSKNYCFSEDKLNHSSINILIKKALYEYSISIKKNAYIDLTKNPKINYEQYIEILKDLYYLDKDALPEDYLEEETKYKELWKKLTKFSSSPENSIESNILLLFLLELNGFFNNEKILKVLKKEIYWIKLEEYDDLIANAKYIEENWNDLKIEKIENIKKLKLEGKYKPIHYEEFYSNYSNDKSNLNSSDENHYLTTLKGNTNYHLIHGYSSKNKNSEDISIFSNSFNKNEENKLCSFSISNFSNKNIRKKVPIKDSYINIMEKKQKEIENIKKDEEKKLKEICTFKPQINKVNKSIFNNNVKVELSKYNTNKSINLHKKYVINNNNNLIENNLTIVNQNIDKKNNPSHSPNLKNNKKTMNQNALIRNKSSLNKMFKDNPLRNDKAFNEKVQQLKSRKESDKNINILTPMRFDIEYPSKFETIGVTINKDNNTRIRNTIFYNIKINDSIKILKYIDGDDLKLNVINFVHKNKLPKEVIDIILTKIKEKIIEEIPKKHN